MDSFKGLQAQRRYIGGATLVSLARDTLYRGIYNPDTNDAEPDDLNSYLNSCREIIYDKQKNGSNQVGSGRVMTITHDAPFFNSDDTTNDKNFNEMFSEKVTQEDYFGQNKRLESKNAKLKEDIARFARRMKLEKTSTDGKVLYERKLQLLFHIIARE